MLKMILNLISAALLALIYFVCKKQHINPIWELEYYLFKCQKYRTLAKIVRAVNRSFTSAEKRQIQLDLIGGAKANIKEFHEILQREIYLLEEQDALKKKALYPGPSFSSRIFIFHNRNRDYNMRPLDAETAALQQVSQWSQRTT